MANPCRIKKPEVVTWWEWRPGCAFPAAACQRRAGKRRRTWRGAIAASSWTCMTFSSIMICSRKFKVHLMFRYNFVPLEETAGWAPGDCHRRSQPVDDDRRNQPAAGQAHRHQSFHAGPDHANMLKKTEQSQARSGRRQRRFRAGRDPRRRKPATTKAISIDRLTAQSDISPIIKLVDTTIFNRVLQRRACDIHIETGDYSGCIKFRT